MQAIELLHNFFKKHIAKLHTTRLSSLMKSVEALIASKKLTLTMLGRHMKTENKMRSNIKKVDRILGNKHLHRERPLLYECMNRLLIAEHSKPWLHIDWSCISDETGLYVLRTSLSVRGRSIVVYEEVHPKKHENNHTVHKKFLKNLSNVLPSTTKPIIVTDAGFRTIWFAEVEKMGWDYVGRLRNKNAVKLSDEDEWQLSQELYALASNTPEYLGSGLLTQPDLII